MKKIFKSLIAFALRKNQRLRSAVFEYFQPEGIYFFMMFGDHQLIFYPNDTIGQSIQKNGDYDRQSVRDLKSQLTLLDKKVEGINILEVGANIGTHTIYLCREFENCNIIAIEPDPQNMRLLLANIHCNELQSRTKAFQVAASDTSGKVAFLRNKYNFGGSSIAESAGENSHNANGKLNSKYEEIMVDAQPLDIFLQDVMVDQGQFNLVWMDVEGHEGKALAGLKRILSDQMPPLYFEITPNNQSSKGLDKIVDQLKEVYQSAYINKDGFTEIAFDDIRSLTRCVNVLVV